MHKFFSFFALSILAISMALTGSITTHAGGFDTGMIVKVTANPSLNIRDTNCKIISQFKYNQTFTIKSNTQKTCNINGSTHYMVESLSGQYVSSNYIQYVGLYLVGNNYITNTATTKSALNIRTGDCKKIGTVKSGTKLTTIANVQAALCTINGVEYPMTAIQSSGKVYYVATTYLTL